MNSPNKDGAAFTGCLKPADCGTAIIKNVCGVERLHQTELYLEFQGGHRHFQKSRSNMRAELETRGYMCVIE